MEILIADDDNISRRVLANKLTQWDYEIVETKDGSAAWQVLQQEKAPRLAVLDWMMPGIDGIEICRKARASSRFRSIYFILLTTRREQEDIIEGLEAGADDYIIKPFESQELKARVQAGARIVGLQSDLSQRVAELEAALSKVRQLEGIVPICSYCKKIRDDKNYWQQLEAYISEHSEAVFSHGVCPDCFAKYAESFRR